MASPAHPRPLNLSGLIAAVLTPFHPDGALWLDQIDHQAKRLCAEQVRGVFVCGTTGEGPSLTTDERRAVADRWCRAAGPDLAVIVHVGHASLAEARTLATHAQAAGAAAIAATAPYFFKPTDAATVAACCADIAAAAPELPIYYYHFPQLTGVTVPAARVVAEAKKIIPNFAGIKFTHDDLADFGRAMDAAPELDAYFGREEMLLSALAIGCRASVGGSFNFTASCFNRLLQAFREGDLNTAREIQARMRQLLGCIGTMGIPAMKAAMSLAGLDVGPPRLPLLPLSQAQFDQVRERLSECGIPLASRG